MVLNVKALAITSAIVWALAVFLTGLVNLVWEGYGSPFLQLLASLYPGYHAGRSLGSVIVGTLYALLDGAICGLAFGWIYNRFARK